MATTTRTAPVARLPELLDEARQGYLLGMAHLKLKDVKIGAARLATARDKFISVLRLVEVDSAEMILALVGILTCSLGLNEEPTARDAWVGLFPTTEVNIRAIDALLGEALELHEACGHTNRPVFLAQLRASLQNPQLRHEPSAATPTVQRPTFTLT